MQLLAKAENLTSYTYGTKFGKPESHLFLISAQCINTESMQNITLSHSCM
jgi:hypothetical protein